VHTHLGGYDHLSRPIGRATICHKYRWLRLQLLQLFGVNVEKVEVYLGLVAGAVFEGVGHEEQLQGVAKNRGEVCAIPAEAVGG
jgi:hypothetical protein